MDINKYFILQQFLNTLRGLGIFSNNISGEYYSYPYEHIRLFNIFNEET
jgi:hypothetical protein